MGVGHAFMIFATPSPQATRNMSRGRDSIGRHMLASTYLGHRITLHLLVSRSHDHMQRHCQLLRGSFKGRNNEHRSHPISKHFLLSAKTARCESHTCASRASASSALRAPKTASDGEPLSSASNCCSAVNAQFEPLWKETATVLRAWLAVRGDVPVPDFSSMRRVSNMTRWGFASCAKLNIASKSRPKLLFKQISPISYDIPSRVGSPGDQRHTQSISLAREAALEPLNTRLDPTEKLEAIPCTQDPLQGQFRPPDKLLALLNGKSLWGAKSADRVDSAVRTCPA